jgi:hypothetical protein
VPMPEWATVITITSDRGVTVLLPASPKGGALRDGRYQSTVVVNGRAVALLNWSVGGRDEPRAGKPVAAGEPGR